MYQQYTNIIKGATEGEAARQKALANVGKIPPEILQQAEGAT
jgi:hypothetical protein